VNKNPTVATVCRYLFTAKLLYMFRVSQHPSSGVLKTVPAASGTGHTTCTATPLQRGLIGTASRSDGFLFTLKERDCLEDKDVDGCKILKRIIKKPNGRQ